MNRDYNNGVHDDITFFVGKEIERTPAYGLKTLFIVGIQPVEKIESLLEEYNCEHIFFGANHSFAIDETIELYDAWMKWEKMINHFLEQKYLCSLDIDLKNSTDLLESILIENDYFIPQIRVPMPYIEQWNYNTMVKLDDTGFNETNPGIWTHRLHDLMDTSTFTHWREYENDIPINVDK